MTASEVEELIQTSKLQSTRHWVPGAGSSFPTLREALDSFDAELIDPVYKFIRVDKAIGAVLGVTPGSRAAWLITGSGTQRVFVDDETGKFGVAWGPDAMTGEYFDLGIRTNDPIDAFLA